MNKEILGIHHVTAIAGDPQTEFGLLHWGSRLATCQTHRQL